ncbi:extracellular solute-binding protein [Martelella mediterranea]|uniref:extracellular solute-binding protein n=1 Tax=Martelella mediterranea TaxID=293089 RepID=UPI001E649FA4|nr:extracellular solute-binding protein [Martelella mediterranea]MCD1634296.1 extracellular solute-binding protein [Martelella mediterranea]
MKFGRFAMATAVAALMALPAAATDVEFMSWTYAEDANKPLIESMIESFDGGEVEAQGYAWGEMNKNYLLRDRTNTLPDVGQSQARLLPIIANIDDLQDFNEIIGRDKLLETFDEGYLAMGEIDGKQLALPWIVGTIGMVANTEVLDAAGVEGIPATMDEFKAALVAVRDNVPNSVPLGLATKNPNSILLDYITWVWTFGGEPLTADGKPAVNSPEAVAALEFMTDAVSERLAAPEIDRPDARRLFAQGATAFYIDAPQALSFARDFSGRGEEIDAAVKPIKAPVLKEGDTPVSIQWGHVLTVFGDENASADSPAVEFVMHLLSDQELVPYAVGLSTLPATKSGIASEEVQSDQYLADWAAASVSPKRNTIASLPQGAEVTTVIGEEVQASLLGQKSPQEAADDMQARLEDILGN